MSPPPVALLHDMDAHDDKSYCAWDLPEGILDQFAGVRQSVPVGYLRLLRAIPSCDEGPLLPVLARLDSW